MIVMAAVNIYSINRLAALKAEIDEVTTNWLPRALAISDINLNTSKLRINQLQHAFAADEVRKQHQAEIMITLIDKINENIDTYEELKADSEARGLYSERERGLYAEFDQKWERYLDLSFLFLRLSQNNQAKEAVALLDGEARGVFNDFSTDLVQLVQVNKEDAYQAADRAGMTYLNTRNFTYILLALTVVFSVFFVAWLVHYITVPVQQLEEAARKVANGDLDVQLKIHSRDEIGNLAHSFNQMTTSLRDAKEKTQEQESALRKQNEHLAKTMYRLKTTQEQLLMKEKMAALGDLVAGVTHEMNSPIAVVNASSDVAGRCINRIDMLLKTGGSPKQIGEKDELQKTSKILKENIRTLRAATDRIHTIVKSLKNFARLDEAAYQSVDIHEGLESTLNLLESDFRERITVRKEYGRLPRIACYPGELNQVFLNLLKNAAQAIEHSGTISIKTLQENQHVHVQISDDGKGIPPDRIQKIFDFGFSAGGARVKMSSGLSTAYNIVQKHNGEIKVTSAVGKGTTFLIILPIQ